MPPKLELTAAQIAAAQMAGIPADRPGLLGEYPKMLFKKGVLGTGAHDLASDANGGASLLPIQGRTDIITRVVEDEADELAAADEGWVDKIDKIAADEAKRGPGRPAREPA